MGLFKICSKCKLEKSFESFSKNSQRKDGLYPTCKQCVAEYNKINKEKRAATKKVYYELNKERISQRAKEIYVENREKVIAHTKKYREQNKEKYAQYLKDYYLKNKDKFKIYAEANRDKIKESGRIRRKSNYLIITKYEALYRVNNRKLLAQKAREYYATNTAKCNKRLNDYRKNNPEKFLALANKRRAAKLNATPKWLTNSDFAEIEELYLCARMFRLYTGEEYHVDHIVPLQGKTVCGLHVLWNLQVIPAKENLSKSNKI
jgi:hypothetical protein